MSFEVEMPTVTITGEGYNDAHFESLKAAGLQVVSLGEPGPNELTSALSSSTIHILGGSERLGTRELEAAPNLKAISFVGTGYSAFVDELVAHQRKIQIFNTPGVMAPAVVEHAIGLMLMARRCMHLANGEAKSSRLVPRITAELKGERIGIVGMGCIGKRIAKILSSGFEADVTYFSRTRNADIESIGVRSLSLDEIFRSSNIIILAIPTTAETQNLVDARLLRLLPAGATLINVAGARLVDPAALLDWLASGEKCSAAFDGYYIEPLPAIRDDPYGLLSLPDDRFLVTPHIAAKTHGSWSRMVDQAVSNVIAFASEGQ